MSVLDSLKSRADQINRERVARDDRLRRRSEKRPDWLPEDWPEGKPYVSLSASYSGGSGDEESSRTDGVTRRLVDPEADVPRLTDEAVEGWRLEAELAARQSVANELRTAARRAGGRS